MMISVTWLQYTDHFLTEWLTYRDIQVSGMRRRVSHAYFPGESFQNFNYLFIATFYPLEGWPHPLISVPTHFPTSSQVEAALAWIFIHFIQPSNFESLSRSAAYHLTSLFRFFIFDHSETCQRYHETNSILSCLHLSQYFGWPFPETYWSVILFLTLPG